MKHLRRLIRPRESAYPPGNLAATVACSELSGKAQVGESTEAEVPSKFSLFESQMQALPPMRPRLAAITDRLRQFGSWELPVRAFSSSTDMSNQSRGGLPRFFSEVLPPSEALSLCLSFSYCIYV